jgi:hypothetical protein
MSAGEDKKAFSECGKIDHSETCFFGACCTFVVNIFFMSEKDYNVLMELAERLRTEKGSDEKVFRSLVRIGLVDENGKLTPPYECLHEILIS